MDVDIKIWVFLLLVLGFGKMFLHSSLPVQLKGPNELSGFAHKCFTPPPQKKKGAGGRTTSVMKQMISFLNDFLCSIWLLNNTVFTTRLPDTFKVTTKTLYSPPGYLTPSKSLQQTTNKPFTTCSRSQAHSSTYLTCGGYITRNTDIDGESTLKRAATRTNNTNISILKWELQDKQLLA